MAKVITQNEMAQYVGKGKAVFPADAILTPLAKDFAAENKIRIITGCCPDVKAAGGETEQCDAGKEDFLIEFIRSVRKNAESMGLSLDKDEMADIVTACLERAGCSVIM